MRRSENEAYGADGAVLAEVLDALAKPMTGDEWDDEYGPYVSNLLDELTPIEWDKLNSRARSESPGLQVRLADALDSHTSPQALILLDRLLDSADRNVAFAAAYSVAADQTCEALREMPDRAAEIAAKLERLETYAPDPESAEMLSRTWRALVRLGP